LHQVVYATTAMVFGLTLDRDFIMEIWRNWYGVLHSQARLKSTIFPTRWWGSMFWAHVL